MTIILLKEKERREIHIKESGHLFILILHCLNIGEIFDNEKKEKIYFLSNK